jgi:ABC-2 type transport system permease protein
LHPDLRKIGTVASTEFSSAVRTKSFIIGILLLPLLTGVSIVVQLVVAGKVDTRPRRVAVIDGSGSLAPAIERAAETFNARSVDAQGKAVQPRILIERVNTEPGEGAGPAQKLELSDRIRRGELDAFVVIPPRAIEMPDSKASPPPLLDFHSDNPNDDLVLKWLSATASAEARSRRLKEQGIDQAIADRIDQPLAVENLGLFERDSSAGAGTLSIKPAQKIDRIRTMLVPAVLMFAMFFVILTTAPQLLNTVLEEKMSKISEVLLGSVTPFELMMGKLLGNTGVGVLLAGLYLGCGYAVAAYYGYADFVSPSLMAALAVFLLVAILLYGSLYMSVGAACNELKDAQSLMMPVMMVSMFPTFVWLAVLKSPSSPLAVGLTLFPPATPFLMLMRLTLRPAPPAWQVGLSIVLATATAFFCVWAAAKIFRTGLLMQGKAPSFRELARWVAAK